MSDEPGSFMTDKLVPHDGVYQGNMLETSRFV